MKKFLANILRRAFTWLDDDRLTSLKMDVRENDKANIGGMYETVGYQSFEKLLVKKHIEVANIALDFKSEAEAEGCKALAKFINNLRRTVRDCHKAYIETENIKN